ncbi:MAG: hypothetical protein PHY47_22855 [Lachnospiraceae bacterium]|nr:hypothetical protein [Lachnospiraceae bacterium]
MNGWVKLYREILEKPIWIASTPEQKTVLITILLMANHEEKEWEFKGERYKCKPGQVITSLESIQKMAGKSISIQNIRTSIKRFEKYNFLTSESTNRNRLITICNWGTYQEDVELKNDNLTSCLTSSQQATNKQLTTNKNDKNDKKNNTGGNSAKIQSWIQLVDDDYRDTVSMFMEYKIERKETFKTEKSFLLMVERLKRLSGGNPEKARLVVEQSMANNWAGLFELKNRNYEQTTTTTPVKTRKKLH